ncbi:VOC family protein [Allomuricauda sp. d1]|uniref:VOC family protein n=1 Tax=Allomuricauda sp. d1 TaxID=3136725 RepID=UPI0031E22F9E
MSYIINGIQQIGIGVSNAREVFNWYRKNRGFDILVFEDVAPASLMTAYTNGEIMNRHALLAMNMQGGGGLEIWQFSDRDPEPQKKAFQWGDLGINAMKLRHTNPEYHRKLAQGPWHNWMQWTYSEHIFCNSNQNSGGVMGAIIGVSNMQRSLKFYQEVLGFDNIKNDDIGVFQDFGYIPGGNSKFRRVILGHNGRKVGGFGKLLGPCEIELIQVLDRTPNKIYENRLWGDLGYIHLCFDISGMDCLKSRAKAIGHDFKVDSADSFDMGKAAGRFGYVEDPDGTLIELVETHKVPIFKPLGLYINLKKRNPEKPLPNWMVKTLRFHRMRKDLKV